MATFFHESSNKTPQGAPSETKVKRGFRVLHGGKELFQKLGRIDPCPCGPGHKFQEMLHADWPLRGCAAKSLQQVDIRGARPTPVLAEESVAESLFRKQVIGYHIKQSNDICCRSSNSSH